MAKLAIAVESATDLPARDYGAHCDPWVSVTVLRDRRSIRLFNGIVLQYSFLHAGMVKSRL